MVSVGCALPTAVATDIGAAAVLPSTVIGAVQGYTASKITGGSAYAFDDFGRNIDPFTGKQKKHGYTKQGNIIQPFAFTGYQKDEVSGLKFAQARYYSADTGRFQSEDNVKGFIDSPFTLNHYGYCWGNPIIFVDNDGNFPTILSGALIGAAIGGAIGVAISIGSDVIAGEKISVKKALLYGASGAITGGIAGVRFGAGDFVGGVNTLVKAGVGAAQGAAANASVLCPAWNGAMGGMVNGAISSITGAGFGLNFVGGFVGNAVTEFSNSEDRVQKGEKALDSGKILWNSAILGFIQGCSSLYMNKATNGLDLDLFGKKGINPMGAYWNAFSLVPGYAWSTLTYTFTDNVLTRNIGKKDPCEA